MIERLGIKAYKELEKKADTLVQRREAIKELMNWIEPELIKLTAIKKRSAMVVNEIGQSYFD